MSRIAMSHVVSASLMLLGVHAYNFEQNLAQTSAKASLRSAEILGAISDQITPDGVITIPLQKKKVNLAQLGVDVDSLTQATIQSAGELAEDESGFMMAETGSGMKVREQLSNSQNTAYMGDLYFGTPPQKIRAIFDTGSANPWVITKEVREEHSFDPTASSSFSEPKDKQWVEIGFGSGDLKGYFATDTVLLGDVDNETSSLSVPGWTFGVVQKADVFRSEFDAIIGMAYPSFAEPGVTPFFEQLRNTGKLDREMHSWFLSYDPDEGSEITMGGWNDEKFHEDELIWHPVVNKLFWALKLDDILVNGVSTGYCKDRNCTVAPDSGTSLVTFPQKHHDEFDETYGGDVDCTEDEFINSAELTYVINGVNYTLPAHHWIERTV